MDDYLKTINLIEKICINLFIFTSKLLLWIVLLVIGIIAGTLSAKL